MQNELKESVEKSSEEIMFEKNILTFGRSIEKVRDDIYLSVYDIYGNLLIGNVPRTFPMETSFSNDILHSLAISEEHDFFYYDEKISVEGYGNLWIRGVTSYSSAQKTLNNVTVLSFVSLPIVLFFILLGGYFVTRKALKPIEKIRKTAEQINVGADLNMRLPVEEGKTDELYWIATTFNSMFQRLEVAFEEEKQFTSDISHEIRTPIAIISLQSENLLNSSNLTDKDKVAVKKIYQQGEKIADLISQMIFLSRTENKKIVLEEEKINLHDLVGVIIEELEPFADEKQVTLINSIGKEVVLYADQGVLIRILTNLLSNSISYNVQNGSVTVSWEEDEGECILSIKDTGIGISKEALSKIWNRFYRVDPSRREMDGTSSGLGLSMVDWLVQIMGWKITATSEIEKGSVFIIKIPKK